MSKFLDKPASDTLYRAIILLQTEEECRNFLHAIHPLCRRCKP